MPAAYQRVTVVQLHERTVEKLELQVRPATQPPSYTHYKMVTLVTGLPEKVTSWKVVASGKEGPVTFRGKKKKAFFLPLDLISFRS